MSSCLWKARWNANVGIILYLKYVLIYYLCVYLCVRMCRISLKCQWRHHKVYLSWSGYIPRVYVTRQPMSLQQWEQAITVGGSHWFRSQWFNEIHILLTTVKFVWLVNKLSQVIFCFETNNCFHCQNLSIWPIMMINLISVFLPLIFPLFCLGAF